MSTNYNNYTFSIFKMNTGILTITSTNKREKKIIIFIPIHLGLTCTWKKNWKVWNFVSPTWPHSCNSLVDQKKIFLTDLHRWLSLSLALSVSVEVLRTWALHSSSFSSFSSFSPLHWLCPLLLSFFNLFRFWFFAFHPFV